MLPVCMFVPLFISGRKRTWNNFPGSLMLLYQNKSLKKYSLPCKIGLAKPGSVLVRQSHLLLPFTCLQPGQQARGGADFNFFVGVTSRGEPGNKATFSVLSAYYFTI